MNAGATFLIMLFSVVAQSHVTVESSNLKPGGYAKLTFRVPHGCEGSATKKISVSLPEGLLSVKPQVHSGWEISTREEKLKKTAFLHGKPVNETIVEVKWSGGSIPDKYMDEFGILVRMPDLPGQKICFPVVQECEKGVSKWVEIEKPDSHFPAPCTELKDTAKSDEHHH